MPLREGRPALDFQLSHDATTCGSHTAWDTDVFPSNTPISFNKRILVGMSWSLGPCPLRVHWGPQLFLLSLLLGHAGVISFAAPYAHIFLLDCGLQGVRCPDSAGWMSDGRRRLQARTSSCQGASKSGKANTRVSRQAHDRARWGIHFNQTDFGRRREKSFPGADNIQFSRRRSVPVSFH